MGGVTAPDDPQSAPTGLSPDALGAALRDVVEYVDADGWNQPPMLFALVETQVLAATQPDLVDPDDDSELSPIAQEPLDSPDSDLEEVLGTATWPPMVVGAVLIQQIVVLPPEAEADLDSAFEPLLGDPDAAESAAREVARAHPGSKVARLAVGALRDGRTLSLLQLRDDELPPGGRIELLSHPDLAPNLAAALAATLEHG